MDWVSCEGQCLEQGADLSVYDFGGEGSGEQLLSGRDFQSSMSVPWAKLTG